ncbi:LytTR family DNA-binding domain-containing protein [Cytophagaceae bacterium DM2B3-1]|uniref:LytTR family DNA-binding domain-containing protein n=1 Tax=Xanthocytophaga flava TaxID=3048013 RepID=A0ABT7CSU0_9BACT|nr:LytTR family DNA-binding domain-containing protein [Xanthocytophaga flavus]MDJ1496736.1 LytTR family DNA-binding domain-containing protein [Xanthocytophaga flavus]
MLISSFLNHTIIRNILGLTALLTVHFIADQENLFRREGFNQWMPYLFLVMLYGGMVLHHRILFDRFYLKQRRKLYWIGLLLALAVSSVNMHYILRKGFSVENTLPKLISFWVYVLTGLGVYVLFRYVRLDQQPSVFIQTSDSTSKNADSFTCTVDSETITISHASIIYMESMENYVKIYTPSKTYITRLTLKQAEERLPKPYFIRISRSHIIHRAYLKDYTPDTIKIGSENFSIGKVYKRHVAELLSSKL